jgi:urease accessory protein
MKAGLKAVFALLALGAAGPAFAHLGGGHAHSFLDGVLHPLTGWDHALVALVVGLIVGRGFFARTLSANGDLGAGGLQQRANAGDLRLPLLFIGGMSLGMLAGASFAFGEWIEQGITLSLLAAGLLLLLWRDAVTPVLAASALAVLLFSGAAHGVVHAVEGGLVPGYLSGILAGTALLHTVGIALGRALGAQALLLRGAGALTAGAGLVVLVGG